MTRTGPPPRRSGLAALEVVMATGLSLPIAAFVYYMTEKSLHNWHFFIANTVGSPLM